MIKKKTEKNLKIERHYNNNTAQEEYKNKINTINNRCNWNHIKTTQKIYLQYKEKERHRGTAENSHIEHCTDISASSDVNGQSV